MEGGCGGEEGEEGDGEEEATHWSRGCVECKMRLLALDAHRKIVLQRSSH